GIQIAGMINGTIEDNILYGNGNGGAAAISLRAFSDGRVINNLHYDELAGGIIFYGCCTNEMQPMSGDLVAYNTILTANGGSSGGGRYDVELENLGPGAPTTLRDNILYNVGHGWSGIVFNNSTDLTDSNSDYNLLANITGPSGTQYTLSQWQALGHEVHSMAASSTSVFVSPSSSNYHLAPASPVLGAGIAVPSITSDLEGNPRPTSGAADIGCYESPLVATANATPRYGAAPLTVRFNSTVGGGIPGYTFAWRFGDGSGSTVQNPTHTYRATGAFSAGLWVNDSAGHDLPASISVFVGPRPLGISLTASPAYLVLGNSSAFAASVTGGTGSYVYSWRALPQGCLSLNQPTILCAPQAPGVYNVSVTASDAATDTGTQTVELQVITPPVDVVVVATPDSLTQGASTVLIATPTGGSGHFVNFAWTGLPTGCRSANSTRLSCTPTGPGNFSTTVTVFDSFGKKGTGTVPIEVAAALEGNAQSAPRSGLSPLTVSFTGAATGGLPPYHFSWRFGDGSGANVSSPVHLYASAGVYTAWLLINDSASPYHHATANVTVTVWSPLTVTLASEPIAIQLGQTTTLTASAAGGTGTFTNYTWSALPPGCQPADRATISCAPSTSGYWNVSVTVSDTGGHLGSAALGVRVDGAVTPGSSLELPLLGIGGAGAILLAVVLMIRRRTRLAAREPPLADPPG
ncbi:MAG: PKD domain-containing protein, partial [Thermoplasmata archaeon]